LALCFRRTLGKALEGLPAGQHSGVIRVLVRCNRRRAMRGKEQGVPRRRWTGWLLLGACCLLMAVVVPLALAQTGYDLSWWTVDGGGAMLSTGEGYRISEQSNGRFSSDRRIRA
jgi:hypothetical protein